MPFCQSCFHIYAFRHLVTAIDLLSVQPKHLSVSIYACLCVCLFKKYVSIFSQGLRQDQQKVVISYREEQPDDPMCIKCTVLSSLAQTILFAQIVRSSPNAKLSTLNKANAVQSCRKIQPCIGIWTHDCQGQSKKEDMSCLKLIGPKIERRLKPQSKKSKLFTQNSLMTDHFKNSDQKNKAGNIDI